MLDHSWDEVEGVFADAIELGPRERERLLSERCTGRPDLRTEVESLLASHDDAGRFLGVATGAASSADALAGDSLSGRAVGRFRLLEKIGEGGMGVVYLGERADGDFDQRVAIKLIRLPAHSADTLRRFRVERQILATLNHPDIVTLLDGGVTASGDAYLAMKFVEGVPITRYCAERSLGLEARLQLFRRVCAAVQHAHHNGIVHRDLKPSNILVASDGLPKVLDFGVAKLLDPSGHAVDATGTSLLRPFTPNYASPEQLRGLPVTTACDVYALGVLLYELLTGAQPYDTTGMPLDELFATVVDRVPRRPSAAPPGAGLPYSPRRLAGDLDAIVLKAMSKEPERRYASAQELADDCARHLARQPVVAREPSLTYYVGRLGRRHRAAFVAAAVSVAALVIALGVSLWQTRVALTERNRAAARFNDVRQLANALIFKIHDQVQPLPGSTPVRQTIVAEALTYLESLSREPAADVALQVELGKAYHRIGAIQGHPSQPNLGDRQAALTSLRKAVALLAPVAGNGAGPREASLELGRAQLALSMVANITGSPGEAVAAARESAVLAELLVARDPEDDDSRRLLGSALFQVALITGGEDAIGRWQRAGEVFSVLLARRPDDPDRQRNVALVQKYLGGVYATANDLPNALSHYMQALALDERRVAAKPDNRQAQFDVAVDLMQIGSVHQRLEAHGQAAAHTQRALDSFSRLAESDQSDRLARGWVLRSHLIMGQLHDKMGNTGGMLRSAAQAVDIGQSLRAIDTLHEVYFSESLTLLGRAERKAGRAEAACDALRRSETGLGSVRESDLSPPTVSTLTQARQNLHEAIAACPR